MSKYGMIAAIWIATLGSFGGGATFLWDYVSTMSAEVGELRAEVRFLREAYGNCEHEAD